MAIGLFALPVAAVATPPEDAGVEFRWDAPAECPSEAEVVAELERLLGGPVASQGDRRLAAIARVRREADGSWDLRLWTVTQDATRQRSMSGADCAVLAEAAALLAAMAIDASVLAHADARPAAVEQAEKAEDVDEPPHEPAPDPPPEPEPAPEPEPQPDEPEPQPDEPEPQPEPPVAEAGDAEKRRPRRFAIATRVHGGISFGDLPGVGPAVRLGFALQWEYARFELEGHYAFVRHARFDDGDLGADLRQGFAVARGCGVLHHRKAKLEFPICAGVEGGASTGRGVGFVDIREGRVAWLAVDANAGLVWLPIPQLGLGVSVEPWVAVLRGRFTAEGVGELWRPLPVGVRAFAGLEGRF
jgi:hypothetical protein